jgi:hypothetical protein
VVLVAAADKEPAVAQVKDLAVGWEKAAAEEEITAVDTALAVIAYAQNVVKKYRINRVLNALLLNVRNVDIPWFVKNY